MVSTNVVTRLDLQKFGFSKYLIQQITQGLAVSWEQKCKAYSSVDIESAIIQKLERPRTARKTRTVLENFQLSLRGESNIVKVDFLPKNIDARLKVLYEREEKAAAYRDEVSCQTEQVLKKAERVLQKSRKIQVM